MDQYLTDQDYEVAKQNGISKINAYNRFYILGWSKEKGYNCANEGKEFSFPVE